MVTKKIKIMFAFCMVFTGQTSRAISLQEISNLCAFAGSALVQAGNAIEHAHDNKHDKQLALQTKQTYESLQERYAPYVEAIEYAYQVTTVTQQERKYISTSTREDFLYQLATKALEKEECLSAHSTLRAVLIELEEKLKNLAERIAVREQDVDLAQNEITNTMRKLCITIQGSLVHFELLYEYLRFHQSYFKLYEAEAHALAQYKSELLAVINCNGDYTKARSAIITGIRLFEGRTQPQFPFIAYKQEIDTHIMALNEAIVSAHKRYISRREWGCDLLKKLQVIKNTVILEPEHTAELRVYGQ